MPTELLHRLRVEGPDDALARLRRDNEIWQAQPWRSMFALTVLEEAPGVCTYRYYDDHKRPAPAAVDIAAAHPDLSFSHEFTDEFGTIAARQRFADGECVEDVHLDARELDWLEWDDEEE